MENKIITELPIREYGFNKGGVDWQRTVGMNVEILYKNNIYSVKVIEYKKEKRILVVSYNGYKREIYTSHFKSCNFGAVLKLKTKEFKYEIGEIIKDDKRDLVITDREYRLDISNNQNKKYYKYTCNKCTWTEGWIAENSLNRGSGCVCCCSNPRVVVPHINSIWAKAPWMIDLGMSKEDALANTCCSHDKITVKCPNCDKEKNIVINSIYNLRSIGCTCGDGKSYPEKFMANVFMQLGMDFEAEYTPEWAEGKRYDFYIPSLNIIIETHGKQHYEESPRGRSLAKEQENDRVKEKLAKNNGINEYIVIDCRKSDMEYIKESILKSKLNDIFDLSKVDWLKCEEFALSNLVKEVCDYWNRKEEWETTISIAKNNIWGIKSSLCINKYLKKGTKLGWTSYDPRAEVRKVSFKAGKSNSKPVEMFKDGISLGVFESASELERQSEDLFGIKLNQGNISGVCNGRYEQYKGFTFKRIK